VEEYVIPARLNQEADALQRAAKQYVECGRNFLYHECQPAAQGAPVHSQLTPRYCTLATICPECAARESGRLQRRYQPRIATALVKAPNGAKLRFVTAGLRPFGTEAPTDALARCLPAFKSLLKICYAVPVTAQEWAIYFQLWPVSGWEVADAGSKAKARKERRRRVRADRLRQGFGAVLSAEFGEQGMKAHCHALVLGRYVKQADLSRCWKLLTGSFIVHVEAADLGDTREVLKYAVKFSNRTPEQLASIYRATCGRRRVEALGCFRGVCELEFCAYALRDRLTCEQCGSPLHPVGMLPHWMHSMGLRAPPNDRPYRFRFLAPAGITPTTSTPRAERPQLGLGL